MKKRSDVHHIFVNFIQLVELQFHTKVKALQSDFGGEYRRLASFLRSKGIVHRFACPHTHEQNGVAEHKIIYVVDTGLAIMALSSLPFQYWPYSFDTIISLINGLPTSVLTNKCPHFQLYGTIPSYSKLKVFSYSIFPMLRHYN